jgi:hypothetical protein
MKDFMEAIGYKITEAGPYQWACYGGNAHYLDYWNNEQDGHSACVVFDTVTQEIYEAAIHDYKEERAYRLINPAYLTAHQAEAEHHAVNMHEAWDGVDYIELEVEEDFLEKTRAIISGEKYDTRVKLPLELEDDEIFKLMTLAHESDMTLNQYVEKILQEEVDRIKNKTNKQVD